MGIVYQLTFFLALGLLATVVTIFVFAVSLLGRAIEVAAKEQEKTTKDQKDAIEIEIAKILKQISSLRKKKSIGKELQELEKRLKKLRKQDEEFARKLGRIVKAPELLTVKGGIVPTASYILGALILSGVAYYLFTIENLLWLIHVLIWILGFAAIGYSIFRIYQSLKVIESIAITSEEAALKRTIESFKTAQKELEEEKKPKLVLTFTGKQPPFHVKADTEMSLSLKLSLRKGEFAENITVFVSAPPGFDFPGRDTSSLPPDHDYPNYVVMRWELERLIGRMLIRTTITIKSPPTVGSFNIVYWIFCKGYESKPTEVEVIVQ